MNRKIGQKHPPNEARTAWLRSRIPALVKASNEGHKRKVAERDARVLSLIRYYRLDLRLSYEEVAAKLNEKGVPAFRGKQWSDSTVWVICKRNDFPMFNLRKKTHACRKWRVKDNRAK